MGALLDVKGVTLQYASEGRLVTAVHRATFAVQESERIVLLGASGCGKSTLLKAIGGYIKPVEGEICLEGKRIAQPGPDRVMMFQEFDQLLPWKTVRGNVVFALTASGRMNAAAAKVKADDLIARVKLTTFADEYPHTLSGGMKQRVALARALAMEPRILLMDEPFAALDALTRSRMQEELLQLWEGVRFTMVFVTHSIKEAITVGSRIVIMSPHPGRVRAEVPSAPDQERRIHELLFGEPPPEGARGDD